jgi:hypothetical protein
MFSWLTRLFKKTPTGPVPITSLSKKARAGLVVKTVRVTGKKVWTPTLKESRVSRMAAATYPNAVAYGDLREIDIPTATGSFVTLSREYYVPAE